MTLNTVPNSRPKRGMRSAPAISGMVDDSPLLRRRRVLLVDDNADLLVLSADLFVLLGYDVLTATAGDEALGILESRSDIDVLFSDVVMPGLDGVRLGHAARQLHPTLHIILVSGFANVATGSSSVHAFDFIPKPYRLSDITRVLAGDLGQ